MLHVAFLGELDFFGRSEFDRFPFEDLCRDFVRFSDVMNGVVDHEEDFLFAIVSNSGLEGSGITIAMNDGSMFDPAMKLKVFRSLRSDMEKVPALEIARYC